MAERWAIAVAGAAAIGAARPGASLVVVSVLAVSALLVRRPWAACVVVCALASLLAQRSLDGLAGVRSGPVEGVATLLTDPERRAGGVEAEVRFHGRHLVMVVRGAAGERTTGALAGERFVVRGSVRPIEGPGAWERSRHLAGRLEAHQVRPGPPPGPVEAAANALRRSLSRGAEPLGARQAALLTGLVVGDDRAQPADLSDDFRGAGLTHLLAVSGQNVAFVLVLVGPLARRLRIWPRWIVLLAVIGAFVVLTRAEPSVTRAGAMAAIATTTVTIGQPVPRLRVLALGVAGLLLVDPLLIHALGFQLSVAAALAIVAAAGPIAAALPGPRLLADALSVTLAAQLGVAPLLLLAFGPLPVAAVPANLLAVPAAGMVMVWGMTAGVVAGVVPAGAAEVLHLPSRLLLGWIEAVAARSASAPLGQLGAAGLGAVAGGLAVLVLASQASSWSPVRVARLRRIGALAVVGAVVAAVLSAQAPPALRTVLAPGVVRWHSAGTDVVVLGGGSWRSTLRAPDVLAALRTDHVGSVDLLVLATAEVPSSVVDAVTDRHPTAALVVPRALGPTERPTGAVPAPSTATWVRIGHLEVLLAPGTGRLVVEARPRPG